MATHSNILAWRVPTDREAWWGYSPWGHRVRYNRGTNTFSFSFIKQERVSQVALAVENMPVHAADIRDTSPITGSERSSGGVHGNPLEYSCLENPQGQKNLVGYGP